MASAQKKSQPNNVLSKLISPSPPSNERLSSSTTTTPAKIVTKSLFRSVLGDSKAKVVKNNRQNKVFSPLAIVKVNSAIRRSMSHAGQRDSPYKILRSRTISKLNG